jgi:hypothetical protein
MPKAVFPCLVFTTRGTPQTPLVSHLRPRPQASQCGGAYAWGKLGGMDSTEQKQISFLPFLPWNELDITLGQVQIYNFWLHGKRHIPDPVVFEHIEKIISRYHETNGKRIEGFCVANFLGNEACEPLSQDKRQYLFNVSLALMFSTIVGNVPGLVAVAPENFVIYYQNFVPGHRSITVRFGSYFKEDVIYSDMNTMVLYRPSYVSRPLAARYDERLLSALVSAAERVNIEQNARIFEALQWIGHTFSNAEGLKDSARIVSMVTSFEILLEFPEHVGKAGCFAGTAEELLNVDSLPRDIRKVGKNDISHTSVGWWCRDFYKLRNAIVHGESVPESGLRTQNGSDHLQIALRIFDGCLRRILSNTGFLEWSSLDEPFWRHRLEEMLRLRRPQS